MGNGIVIVLGVEQQMRIIVAVAVTEIICYMSSLTLKPTFAFP